MRWYVRAQLACCSGWHVRHAPEPTVSRSRAISGREASIRTGSRPSTSTADTASGATANSATELRKRGNDSGRARPVHLCWWLRGEESIRDEKRALCRRLLEEIERTLRERDLDHFVLLFHARSALVEIGPYSWQEPFLHETLRELGMPFVSSKRALLEDMAATGRFAEQYLPLEQHYDAAGNAAVFPALLRGLRGEFEPPGGYLPGAPPHPRERR